MDYKERLEEAKRLYETATPDQKYVLESLSPELQESEDEKIREMLIRIYKKADMGGEIFGEGITYKQVIAWLEKQGEQKPVWSEEDERNLKGIIDEIEANKNNAPDYDLATYDRFLSWLKSLKDRIK